MAVVHVPHALLARRGQAEAFFAERFAGLVHAAVEIELADAVDMTVRGKTGLYCRGR